MSKRQERQRFIRHYKDVTGEQEIDMHKVAAYAKRIGWKMTTLPSDVEPGFFKLALARGLFAAPQWQA
jgi:hypothetical protein